jgi:NAD(P)-dependent dehydrogenase (short-subunit alcohol dehydrogenase family)
MALDIDLAGRTALVTGASRGIGWEVAMGLAAAGAGVVGLARSERDLAALGGEIEAGGGEFLPLIADISSVERLADAAEAAWNWHAGVDILVNVAGIIIREAEPPFVTPEQWDSTFAVNLRGPFFLCQELGRRMLAGGGGSIINVASIAGEVVTRATVPYQASKAALLQLTRALAVRWAPTVRVNAVSPGYIRTNLNAALLDQSDLGSYVRDRTPLGRVGTPEDVRGAVIFLASPAAVYVTGHNLVVDGGWLAQ